MKTFMGQNFLLNNDTAKALYHQIAAELPSPSCGWAATIISGVP